MRLSRLLIVLLVLAGAAVPRPSFLEVRVRLATAHGRLSILDGYVYESRRVAEADLPPDVRARARRLRQWYRVDAATFVAVDDGPHQRTWSLVAVRGDGASVIASVTKILG